MWVVIKVTPDINLSCLLQIDCYFSTNKKLSQLSKSYGVTSDGSGRRMGCRKQVPGVCGRVTESLYIITVYIQSSLYHCRYLVHTIIHVVSLTIQSSQNHCTYLPCTSSAHAITVCTPCTHTPHSTTVQNEQQYTTLLRIQSS